MSFCSQLSSRCSLPCEVQCPQPVADAWSQPCVTSCGDSRAVLYPPPVSIVFPGPILSSCPQESVVGTSLPVGPAGSFGWGSSGGAQSSWGSGASLAGRYSYPCYSRYSTYPGMSRPAQPGKGSLDDKIQQKKEQICRF
ncbi:feather keratin 4-like [Neopelma chrysocephalum]|uniref:feather keratin 4-like n=1 Tax=Neopelma chrysocephalum TaxID=114329 RepID=UPI000FCCFBF5|nr:feather keratin 4-like [Neopelma chrysocephalum]